MSTRPATGLDGLLAAAQHVPAKRPEGRPAAPRPVAEPPATAVTSSRPRTRPLAVRTPEAYLSGQQGRRLAGRRIRTPLAELELIARQRRRLAEREAVAVKSARRQGVSWPQVAQALEVPLTTVHRRFR